MDCTGYSRDIYALSAAARDHSARQVARHGGSARNSAQAGSQGVIQCSFRCRIHQEDHYDEEGGPSRAGFWSGTDRNGSTAPGRGNRRCAHTDSTARGSACRRCRVENMTTPVFAIGSKTVLAPSYSPGDGISTTVIWQEGARPSKNDLRVRFRRDWVPAMISRKAGGRLELSNFEHATHLLAKVLEGESDVGDVVFNLFGTAVRGFALSADGITAYYYAVNQPLSANNKSVLALLSRYFCEATDLMIWDDPTDMRLVFAERPAKYGKSWTRTRDDLDDLPKPKISAQHHLHFSVGEILDSAGDKANGRLAPIGQPFDVHDSMLASTTLWAISVEQEVYDAVVYSGLFNTVSIADFIKHAKRLSVLAKSWQNLCKHDLRELFELDVLVNRVEGVLDWEAEKQNRASPQFSDLSYDYVLDKARAIFTSAAFLNKTPQKFKWKEFWDSRWQWSAAGSIHSQYSEDMAYVSKDRLLKNKFIAINAMPEYGMHKFLERVPAIHAWSSYKYEWGKLRAIYGTDLTSYILAQFAFYNCEECLPRQFPVGHSANEKNVTARVAGILTDKLPLCIDYEDFNSQHSAEAMSAVIQAYIDVFQRHLTPDQLEAAHWTKMSVLETIVHDNMGTKTQYRTRGTLLSGWRLTTFMNSVLNYIYTREIVGEVTRPGNSLHNGDDVILGVDNLIVAQAASRNARAKGIRLQRSKCAFAGIAEFLRVDHVRGSRGQYLSRACATLVHSRIESRMSTDARDLVESLENRFDDCINRGMPLTLIAALRETYYCRQAQICRNTVEDFYTIKTTHRAAGGVSKSLDSDVSNLIVAGRTERGDTVLPVLPGVSAYAWQVKEKLLIDVSFSRVRQRIENATYEAVLLKSRSVKIVPTEDRWYAIMRSLYKAHRGAIRVKDYGKAALTGYAYELLVSVAPNEPLTLFLKNSSRPLDALPLVV
uniref:RNA-directed RNA polymerase n=1 Tax=Nanning Totiv tick virus 3 TaxID=2972354 RepID=A0A9E7V2F2_9VIRU|nr:MAG: RNA-dependent RNA polymerase [Nanning Totiv tick virus 3]